MTSLKLHSGHIEVAVANLFNYRLHTIVPNVSWGLGLSHECDMLILDKQGRFTEVEIKISLSDFKADFKKGHGHQSQIISRLVYAFPEKLDQWALENVPVNSGLISVRHEEKRGFIAEWIRVNQHSKHIQKPSDKIISKFMSLGCMRIWSLKTALYKKGN